MYLSLGRVYDWSPCVTVQEHTASWVHWRYRQTMSLQPPPLWMPKFDGDLSILVPSHNFQPPKCLLYELGDRPCCCGAPECPPRFLGNRWKVVPLRYDMGVPGSSGRGRCRDHPKEPSCCCPTCLPCRQRMQIRSSYNFCKDVKSQLLGVDSR